MAINTATIQHRRGSLDDFNPEKLTPGELAVITDERSVYMGFPGGEAEKIVLEKDFTSESIKEKLGYEPADEERVDQLFRDKADYQYVDKKVSNVKVDLTGYAKEDYVDDEIEELNKKIVQETGKLSEENAELKEDLVNLCIGKNLVGTEGGKPYACFIPNGSKVTFSTSDGSLKSGDALYIHFLDANKNQIDSSTFTDGVASRTVVAHADVFYIRLSRSYNVPIQVEIGETVTEYKTYMPNQKQSYEDENAVMADASGKITFVAYPNVYVKKTGEITNWSDHSRTAFINCSCYDYLRVSSAEASEYNCFYDADKNIVSNFAIIVGEKDFIIPNNAKYVMFSTTTANISNLQIYGIRSAKNGELVAIKSNGSAFWSNDNNDGNFVVSDDVYVFGDGSDSIVVTKDSIIEVAQDSSLTTVENDVIKGKAFVIEFNYKTKDISIKPYYNYHASDNSIILYAHYYGTNHCGALVDYMVRKKTLDINKDEVPTYWEAELNTSIESITNLESESGVHGDRLVFFTDYHTPNNSGNSHNLIKEIINKCGISKVVFGGDIVDERSSISLALKDISDFKSLFSDINMYSIIGNHEYNNPSSSESKLDVMPTTSQVFNIMCKDKENKYGNIGENGEYWFDNTVQKIRYFVIPSNYHSWIIIGSRKWFAEQVAYTPSGYTIVVLSHIGFKIENGQQMLTDQFSIIASVMDAVKNKTSIVADGVTYDYSGMNCNVACALTGHLHKDSYTKTSGGIPIFGTTCDSMREDATGLVRTLKTSTENAFDVVDIDTENRKINLIRVGAGSDRIATY